MTPDREIYKGFHRGIDIEVCRHHGWRGDVWCFYLCLLVEQFPQEIHADLTRPSEVLSYGSILQPYAECLQDLNWHGGMGFYRLEKRPGYPFTEIKAGCDYSHLWDEGQTYTAEGVMWDAKNCVDSLFHKFPTLKTTEQLWGEFRATVKESTPPAGGPHEGLGESQRPPNCAVGPS